MILFRTEPEAEYLPGLGCCPESTKFCHAGGVTKAMLARQLLMSANGP